MTETEIRRALSLLALPGVFEIRAPKTRQNSRYESTAAGYFDNPDDAVKAVAKLAGRAPGIYVTLNPVDPALLARAANRLDPRAKHTTSDVEIIARRWLLLDFDPVRPAGISSNDAEHQAALERAVTCEAWMTAQGWPAPLYADSGNGAHLLYRLDLPNDADSKALVEAVLKALANRFDDEQVKLDTGVGNAARITKLYGTQARKGDPLPDRPHRMSRLLQAPETPSPVDLEHLRALVPPPVAPAPPPARASSPSSFHGGDFFAQVNSAAMLALAAWVPVLFPAATSYHDGYRVSSKGLARDLEEDLSITPAGIVDFGLADQGDPRQGKRTPIDLVIEHGHQPDAKTAALWLCSTLSIDPVSRGWQEPKAQLEPYAHARACERVNSNPSHPSCSSQSNAYPFTTENQPFISITINDLSLEDGKELLAESIAAKKIADELQGKLAFSNEAMVWHMFTKTHWQPVSGKEVEDLLTGLFFTAAPNGFDLRYFKAVSKLLGNGLLPLRQSRHDGAIPFKNGIFDPATMTLHPVTPDNALTWSLPYSYEPAADCPTIKRWLRKSVDGDEETMEFLRAWLNAVLVGRPDLQKFLHLLGPGGTGKGTFIRLATKLVGERNRTITDLRNLETNRFETASLYEKRLVAITDSANYRGDVSVFKSLTGQDPIRLERKHQQQSGTFTYAGMVILASNEGLMAADLTSGIERRRLTVEFNHVASADERADWDAQGGEAAVLHREIPGLVNWLLELSREEVTNRIMRPPRRAELANLDALRFANPLADWILERTVPCQGVEFHVGDKQTLPGGGLLNDDKWLYPNYLDWCRRNARRETVSLVRFTRLIIDVGRMLKVDLVKKRRNDGTVIIGLKLLPRDQKNGDFLNPTSPDEGFSEGFSEGFVNDKWLKVKNMKGVKDESNLSMCARTRVAIVVPNDPYDPKTPSSENYGGLSMAELLPARLAQAAGLDLDAMLSGRLREEDFSKLSDGAADLARCLDHDQQQHLAELLAQIDAAAQPPAP